MRYLFYVLLLLLSLSLYSQTYEITETQLTKLETTIASQKISIDEQALLLTNSQNKITQQLILLENSKQEISSLQNLTAISGKLIKQQEILLDKSENRSLIDSIKTFFVGLLTGSCIVTIIYLINV